MTTTKTFLEKVMAVQSQLKAPKNQMNKFGGYRYRSCEDIMEALKPLLLQEGLVLIMKDDIEVRWEPSTVTTTNSDGEETNAETRTYQRFYVKATATLYNVDNMNECLSTTAYAREEEAKKGMDWSQLSGSSSSYARKYCLNAMFLIDDTKDADTWNTWSADNKSFEELKWEIQKAKSADTLSKVAKMITSSFNAGVLSGDEQKELKELYNSKTKELKS